ncbi:histidine kinase [Virgisporangium aliadipatigenens]|uniref:histidine kinase n=1 Tax=Virgisporangium aliadipatigenens TaxID=741659 RepID=A0A8J3YNJ9_9ACTN|nr:sensor histidine kinase [Virgisporangium aliadipatigenens]GIJ46943.1 histidine kinase [Virgisporangium aliadipatigenens]
MESLWRALTRPHRFFLSAWPWRALEYLAGSVLLGVVCLPVVLFPPALLLLARPVGAAERWRLRRFERVPARGRQVWWREFGYLLVLTLVLLLVDGTAFFALFLCALFLFLPAYALVDPSLVRLTWDESHVIDTVPEALALSVGVVLPFTLLALYGTSVLAGAQAAFARWLVVPEDVELARELAEVSTSRSRLVRAFEAERRRIERDLHDGAQQHLVLLTMTLGMAQAELRGTDGRAVDLVGEARQQARQALAAIRELIHGIHPQVLTDLGLRAALEELAERCPVPLEIELELTGRLPAAVESTAYFVAAEAVTNAVRHADPRRITVAGGVHSGRLALTVTDDGRGGADPAGGSGLRGLVDRTAVVSGTLVVDSPAGGPTTVRMEVPCP